MKLPGRLLLTLGLLAAVACGGGDDDDRKPFVRNTGGRSGNTGGRSSGGTGGSESGGRTGDGGGDGGPGGSGGGVDGGSGGSGGLGGSGGAGGSGGEGAGGTGTGGRPECTLATGVDECDGCIHRVCATQCATCEGNDDCAAVVECVLDTCTTNPISLGCVNGCRAKHPGGDAVFTDLVFTCGRNSCSSFCPFGG